MSRPVDRLQGLRRVLVVVVAISVCIVAGCAKKAGSACKAGESLCPTKDVALNCVDGKMVEVACRGPLACTMFEGRANCDEAIASAGDTCMGRGDDEYACTADKKRALVCKNGKFERYLECRGPGGCALLGQQVSCDTSVSAKNDPCKVPGSSACSDDVKELLTCRDGRFAHYRYCRGPSACYTKDGAPACDETRSLEQDECGLPGYVVCSIDGKSELLCQGGRYVKSRSCKNGCTLIAGGRGGIDCK